MSGRRSAGAPRVYYDMEDPELACLHLAGYELSGCLWLPRRRGRAPNAPRASL